MRRLALAMAVAAALCPAPAQAQDDAADGEETVDDEISVPSLLGGSVANTDNEKAKVPLGHRFVDWLWEVPEVIDRPDARVLQRLRFVGRYHGQYAHVDSNQADTSEWDHRRMRLGLNIQFLKNFTMQTVWKIDGDEFKFDENNIDNHWIAWRRWDAFGIKVGQQKPLWSQEWSTSSNALITFERSLLINQLRPRHSLGIYASGEAGPWAYGAGWFQGEIGMSADSSEGDIVVVNLARDFGDWFHALDDARWRVDYLYNGDSGQITSGEFGHAFATSVSGKLGGGRLTGEVIYATGADGGDDAFGVTLTPSIDLVPDKLQLVFRYHYAHSGGDMLMLRDRYETASGAVGDGRGDRYHSLYGGLNWYLRGNKLKFMTGVEYADMNDPNDNGGNYNGWTILGGVRLSF